MCKKVYVAYLSAHKKEQEVDLISLVIHLDDDEGQRFVSEILQKKINKEKAEEQLENTIQKMLDRNWMLERENVKNKILGGDCSDEEALTLAKKFDELRKSPPILKKS